MFHRTELSSLMSEIITGVVRIMTWIFDCVAHRWYSLLCTFFFLVLYVLFTSLHTLVKMIEKASSCAVFSQIKPRSVTSNLRYSVCTPYSIERNLEVVLSLNSWLDSELDLSKVHIGMRQSRKRKSTWTGWGGLCIWPAPRWVPLPLSCCLLVLGYLKISSCYSWGWSFLQRAHWWCSSSAQGHPAE